MDSIRKILFSLTIVDILLIIPTITYIIKILYFFKLKNEEKKVGINYNNIKTGYKTGEKIFIIISCIIIFIVSLFFLFIAKEMIFISIFGICYIIYNILKLITNKQYKNIED